MSYSAPITHPKTKLEGLQSFVQLIINKIESGEHREALFTAVDLRADLHSTANPYASVTDGTGNALMQALRDQHAAELADAIAKSFAEGIKEGRRLEKQSIAEKLGLITA